MEHVSLQQLTELVQPRTKLLKFRSEITQRCLTYRISETVTQTVNPFLVSVFLRPTTRTYKSYLYLTQLRKIINTVLNMLPSRNLLN